jgi:hypothetical protein
LQEGSTIGEIGRDISLFSLSVDSEKATEGRRGYYLFLACILIVN